MWNSLEESTDMWEHLFAAMVRPDESGTILYWGGKRAVRYRGNLCVRWVPSMDDYKPDKAPDVIFARGGFHEYDRLLRRYSDVIKAYYGANHGIPKRGASYDCVFADTANQRDEAVSRGFVAHKIYKPAAPNFYPRDVTKKYHCCFVAIHSKDRRKRVDWVYRTVPRHLKVLHLGYAPHIKPPSNIVVKRTTHDKMPKAMSKCKILIAPYSKEDSGPRVIPEAIACGLHVVVLDDTYTPCSVVRGNKVDFWQRVEDTLAIPGTIKPNVPTAKESADRIRKQLVGH